MLVLNYYKKTASLAKADGLREGKSGVRLQRTDRDEAKSHWPNKHARCRSQLSISIKSTLLWPDPHPPLSLSLPRFCTVVFFFDLVPSDSFYFDHFLFFLSFLFYIYISNLGPFITSSETKRKKEIHISPPHPKKKKEEEEVRRSSLVIIQLLNL